MSLSSQGKTSCSNKNFFREVNSDEASVLTDGIRLSRSQPIQRSCGEDSELNSNDDVVVLPWLGFGTYKLGQQSAYSATLQALEAGYRCIDTAFIYGGEKTETAVGKAIETALENGILQSRHELFVTTKHWRKYHGYEASLKCLKLSLKRLKLDYVDLWLMHWPGPAYNTMARRKDVLEKDGPWAYSTVASEEHMIQLRAETWRAMEDALRIKGLCRAVGVSNFSVRHLETLKKTATLWPPAVNQVELHPLHPQISLREYCESQGIVVQAYASLGGQDMGKKGWKDLLGIAHDNSPAEGIASSGDRGSAEVMKKRKKPEKQQTMDLLHSSAVLELAQQLNATPGQILLRWGLRHNCALIPKTVREDRLLENAAVLNSVTMSRQEADDLQAKLAATVRENHPGLERDNDDGGLERVTRLCWRNDPLRHLDFD